MALKERHPFPIYLLKKEFFYTFPRLRDPPISFFTGPGEWLNETNQWAGFHQHKLESGWLSHTQTSVLAKHYPVTDSAWAQSSKRSWMAVTWLLSRLTCPFSQAGFTPVFPRRSSLNSLWELKLYHYLHDLNEPHLIVSLRCLVTFFY